MGIYNWGINLENMRATKANGGLVDSDEAKAAFKWYVDMLQWAPPGVKTYTWDETAATFGAGKVAQGIIYLENLGWWSDPAQSEVAGKLVLHCRQSPKSFSRCQIRCRLYWIL